MKIEGVHEGIIKENSAISNSTQWRIILATKSFWSETLENETNVIQNYLMRFIHSKQKPFPIYGFFAVCVALLAFIHKSLSAQSRQWQSLSQHPQQLEQLKTFERGIDTE